MAFPNMPDTWAWDDHDMFDDDEASVAAHRAEIIHNQIESFVPEALPWVEADCGA